MAPVYLAALILFFETVREPSLFLQILGAPSVAEETHAMAPGPTPRAGMALRTAALQPDSSPAVPPAGTAPRATDGLSAARQETIAVMPAAAESAAVFSDKAASDVAKQAAGDAAPALADGAAPGAPEEAPFFLAAASNLSLGDRPYADPRAGLPPPAAPIDPTAAAAAEEALRLSRGDRREVQRRLRFAESDPQMIDGVFGPATRSAIAAWQERAGLPATGFMDEPAMAMLVEHTADEYRAWRAAERTRAKGEEEQRDVVASSAPPRWPRRDPSECRRLPSGEIAFGGDVGCNFRAFGENFKRDFSDLKSNVRQLLD